MAESQLTDIVRRIITSLQNLPEGTEDSAETRASSQPANLPNRINSSADNNSVEQEPHQRFQIPRANPTTVATPARYTARNGSGRFVPYSTLNKRAKGKGKSPVELVIKDVCLLPDPQWDKVPRRQIKEDLIKQNLFVDAWTLDKLWSEETLRKELQNLFKDHISDQNE